MNGKPMSQYYASHALEENICYFNHCLVICVARYIDKTWQDSVFCIIRTQSCNTAPPCSKLFRHLWYTPISRDMCK